MRGGRYSCPRDVLSDTVTLRPMMLLWERGRERGRERCRGRHSWPRDVLSNTVTLGPMMLLWERGRERGREAQLA